MAFLSPSFNKEKGVSIVLVIAHVLSISLDLVRIFKVCIWWIVAECASQQQFVNSFPPIFAWGVRWGWIARNFQRSRRTWSTLSPLAETDMPTRRPPVPSPSPCQGHPFPCRGLGPCQIGFVRSSNETPVVVFLFFEDSVFPRLVLVIETPILLVDLL